MRETHSWIAAVVVVAILIVIGLVIGTVKVITYYKCNKMCPLPFHSCSVDYPLFKLIKCCCKGGYCPILLIHNNSKQHNGNRLISSWFDILLSILIVPSYAQICTSISAYWPFCLRSKCFVCWQHIDLKSWMCALSWYPFHRWSVQVLCIVTAQGCVRCGVRQYTHPQ